MPTHTPNPPPRLTHYTTECWACATAGRLYSCEVCGGTGELNEDRGEGAPFWARKRVINAKHNRPPRR